MLSGGAGFVSSLDDPADKNNGTDKHMPSDSEAPNDGAVYCPDCEMWVNSPIQ